MVLGLRMWKVKAPGGSTWHAPPPPDPPPPAPVAPAATEAAQPAVAVAPAPPPPPAPEPPKVDPDQQVADDAAAVGMTTREPAEGSEGAGKAAPQ